MATAKPDKKEFYNLYENEMSSDIVLLIGDREYQERLPAHSWILASGSDVFKAQFCGPHSKPGIKEFHFPHDDAIGFNNLIMWLYQNKCDLPSLQISLDTLEVAIKYLCPDLAVDCMSQITKQLTVKNVLKVIQAIQLYSDYAPPPAYEDIDKIERSSNPSAPSIDDIEDKFSPDYFQLESFLDPTVCCQQLFNECLDILDNNVVDVLNSEYFVDSNETLVMMVLRRPTLKVNSEMDIFRALYRWSTAVCKRKHLSLTLQSRRNVLGSMVFQARLLTLSIADLKASRNDLTLLLNEQEINYILSCSLSGGISSNLTVPSTLVDHLKLLSTPRLIPDELLKKSHQQVAVKSKKKSIFKKRINKKELILDLVSVLAMIFD